MVGLLERTAKARQGISWIMGTCGARCAAVLEVTWTSPAFARIPYKPIFCPIFIIFDRFPDRAESKFVRGIKRATGQKSSRLAGALWLDCSASLRSVKHE